MARLDLWTIRKSAAAAQAAATRLAQKETERFD
jgi:hypothetical protein